MARGHYVFEKIITKDGDSFSHIFPAHALSPKLTHCDSMAFQINS